MESTSKDYKDLMDMEIGEAFHVEYYEVLRVPGGWVYTRFSENGTGGYEMSSCFVPIPPANSLL